jgi:hypothetical protein
MTTLNYVDLFLSKQTQLRVPDGTEDMTTLDAALTWAKNGFYLLPINRATKHAGSVVGVGWPEKSSRDSTQLHKWFENSDYGLALHVGKSGAIAFDVDDPGCVPYVLRQWMELEDTPFQSTRTTNKAQGHYLFGTELGKSYGNSKGRLTGGWGEVRGKNGIIVISPTPHSKSSEGGRYKWMRTGPLPYLPFDLQKRLPEGRVASALSVDLSEVDAFISKFDKTLLPELLDERIADASKDFMHGSRHDAARNLLVFCLREAMAGLYEARRAVESIANLFLKYKPREEWSTPTEFVDMARWAVAQIESMSEEDLASIRDIQLTISHPGVRAWIGGTR